MLLMVWLSHAPAGLAGAMDYIWCTLWPLCWMSTQHVELVEYICGTSGHGDDISSPPGHQTPRDVFGTCDGDLETLDPRDTIWASWYSGW